jgi:hypothetical protein
MGVRSRAGEHTQTRGYRGSEGVLGAARARRRGFVLRQLTRCLCIDTKDARRLL